MMFSFCLKDWVVKLLGYNCLHKRSLQHSIAPTGCEDNAGARRENHRYSKLTRPCRDSVSQGLIGGVRVERDKVSNNFST